MSDLILYPQDIPTLFKILLVPFVFELLRIVLGRFPLCFKLYLFTVSRVIVYFFVAQSSQFRKLENEKIRIQFELSQIKSVQLELVKNSKLERNLIKTEKEIEKLKANQIPKEKNAKYYFRIGRVLVYLTAGIYFSSFPVFLISPKVILFLFLPLLTPATSFFLGILAVWVGVLYFKRNNRCSIMVFLICCCGVFSTNFQKFLIIVFSCFDFSIVFLYMDVNVT
jgi:hypothetical protein